MATPPPIPMSAPDRPRPWRWGSLRRGIEWIDRAFALSALALAMARLVQIDRGLIGFALCWFVPPVVLAGLTLRRGASVAFHAIVGTYLGVISVGAWIATSPGIFPALNSSHPGDTDFARLWNRLDVVSRRLIAWNGGATALLLIFGLGWPFFAELRRRARTGRGRMSAGVAGVAVAVLWGLGLSLLLGLLAVLLGPA